MKVLVALSGGVDSATAAALLKRKGFSVAGAIMVFKGICEEEIKYAHKVCEHLNIPFYTLDFKEYYQKEIIENFIREYELGRTPNPCIRCNQLIKFGLFLSRAREMGFDKIATGHYANIEKKGSTYLLKRGIEKNEQSYFLYRLNQQQLARISLPLGGYTKEEVRNIAIKLKLPTAHRKKSQDICFLREGDYTSYLKAVLPEKKGPIFDKSGKRLGLHKGVVFYTYGQRKGLGISHKMPYYVVKIDAENNAIYVGEKADVYKRALIAKDSHFILAFEFAKPLRVQAKSRYYSLLAWATIEPYPLLDPLSSKSGPAISKGLNNTKMMTHRLGDGNDKKIKVVFDKLQWALTPGQSVVFYQKDRVLGGGIIEEVIG